MDQLVKLSKTHDLSDQTPLKLSTICVTYPSAHLTYAFDIQMKRGTVYSVSCRQVSHQGECESGVTSSSLNDTQDNQFIRDLQAYLSGQPINLSNFVSLDSLLWSELTPFEQAVYRACLQIPLGSVVTYGMLARQAGYPKAIRAVGTCLGKNDHILVIPCHRVVPAHVYAKITHDQERFFRQSVAYAGGFRYGADLKYLLLKQEYLSLRDLNL